MRNILQRTRLWAWYSGWEGHRILWTTGMGVVVALLLAVGGGALQSPPRPIASHTGTIPAAEFSRLIQDFSEKGGNFFADNFTSNESAYLYILKPLQELGATGGAYVGVGPEQNFTYLAHIRPEIAFIVDIRRQAVIQHLMYKAIFQLAPTRAEFLSLLFSKPLDGPGAPKNDAPIEEILRYFFTAQSNEGSYRTNLIRLEKMIRQEFRFPLTEDDHQALAYLYRAFYNADLTISFRMTGRLYGRYWGARFPNLAELILATDQDGNAGSFLVTDSAYQFVRQLQRQNRVIPVVGDFGGTKALAAVADYLTR
ncbi:MAG: hypothetical protein HYX73_00485, partial [Acidobacteria bacterium]|nr:hypothetical protein [Acidobacteriota bacterium]